MCGIAGIFHYATAGSQTADRDVAQRMTNSLVHRGPDDGGLYCRGSIALGHRRLAILDLSPRGRQPMGNPAGTQWIAFNGEIYNFRGLRTQLEENGRRFTTQTDTEVILQAYAQWDMASIERLNGMFAFAIWDEDRQRLWLVRDPIGIKPLFYHDDGNTFRFGSEVKAILADPAVPRRPDLAAIDSFLTFAYTPAPSTGFEGIRQLPPGHCLMVDSRGVRQWRYHQWPYPSTQSRLSEQDAVDAVRAALESAVQRQMVSDVPVGAFLSGGLDSSAILWAMQQHGGTTRAFCVGFEDQNFDESQVAREVAQRLHASFHSECMSPRVEELLPVAIAHAEEPLADNSMLAVFMLCQMTRPHATVALSGDGGDELLAGYSTYRATQLAASYRRVPRLLRQRLIWPLVQRLPHSGRKYAVADLARRFAAGAEQGPLRDHASWRQIFRPDQKRQLYSSAMQAAVGRHDPLAPYVNTLETAPADLTLLEQSLHMDLNFHLPNDMLVKVDRMSMAHALEVRVPLLDLEMIKTCLNVPAAMKLRGRQGKWVLKQVLQDVLPHKIVHRRKSGFLLPIERWLQGPLQSFLQASVRSGLVTQSGLLQPHYVKQLVNADAAAIRHHAYQLFTLLVLSLWWRIWIDQDLPLECVRPAKWAALNDVTRSPVRSRPSCSATT